MRQRFWIEDQRKEIEMKTRFALMLCAAIFALVAWTGAAPVSRSASVTGGSTVAAARQIAYPDLVVTSIRFSGRPRVEGGSAKVPITVIVKNQGSAPATKFKVALEYRQPDGGTFAVSFVVPGETDSWYPWTDVALAPGRSVAFSGEAVFNPSVHRTRVSIWAVADSCSGDEFMEDYCRVKERNERNNKSAMLSVALP